jgi:hypothetical protein
MYKFKIKAIILFERLMNKPFEIKTLEDIYVYFYCVRKVTDESDNETFEDLLDKCDADPLLIKDFLEQFAEHNKRQNALSN